MSYEPTKDDRHAALEQAAKVGKAVREYVRDRFTPGALHSLDQLRDLVEEKVHDEIIAAVREHGTPFQERAL